MNQLLGVTATWYENGLSIEVNNNGIVSLVSNVGHIEETPKILYEISRHFKYGHNFIIKIYSESIEFTDRYISFYKYKLNPINLDIISNWKTITYSGKSTTNIFSIREDEIDAAFQKIDPITNPKFTAQIHGQDSHKIEYSCTADFHHCKACPFKSQVINCILGHKVAV